MDAGFMWIYIFTLWNTYWRMQSLGPMANCIYSFIRNDQTNSSSDCVILNPQQQSPIDPFALNLPQYKSIKTQGKEH